MAKRLLLRVGYLLRQASQQRPAHRKQGAKTVRSQGWASDKITGHS